MGLCIIEGGAGAGGHSTSNRQNLKSGEALLIALGGAIDSEDYSACYFWDYHNSSYPTNGFMRFAHLDFTDVYSFTFNVPSISQRDTENGTVTITNGDGSVTYISQAKSGTVVVDGATDITIKTNATNYGTAYKRYIRFTSYIDMDGNEYILSLGGVSGSSQIIHGYSIKDYDKMTTGEAFLNMVGSTGAILWGSKPSNSNLSVNMKFNNLNFSNIKSFTYDYANESTTGQTSGNKVIITDSQDNQIMNATNGTCEINGKTNISIEVQGLNGTDAAPNRIFKILSYIDINNVTHDLISVTSNSGQGFLIATGGSIGTKLWFSKLGNTTSSGSIQFNNLDFSNVKSFTFDFTSTAGGARSYDNKVTISDSDGTNILEAASGVCKIGGKTGITIKASGVNGTDLDPNRMLRILSFTDMNNIAYDLTGI